MYTCYAALQDNQQLFFFLGIIYMLLADATALIQIGAVLVALGAVLVLAE